ncbi:MAG: hypothetical protein MI919_17680 [Holophagales bacterium]|nr:hypothetical protein [Holophagales bacterium]
MKELASLWVAGETQARQRVDLSRLYNPPRRHQLNYRVGTCSTFLRSMYTFLFLEEEAGGKGNPIDLSRDAESNWILALLSSWAEAGDVLSFYQERWIQEGFLRTAVQEESLRQLAAEVGYEPRPAASGTARLAVLLDELQSLPSRLILPPHSRIESAPKDESPSQVFETSGRMTAERSLNLLDLLSADGDSAARALVPGDASSLVLTGGPVALGDALLIRTRSPGSSTTGDGLDVYFRVVSSTTPVAGRPQDIEVGFTVPLGEGREPASGSSDAEARVAAHLPGNRLEIFDLHILRQQSRLFGASAPEWDSAPLDIQRQYQPLQGGILLGGDASSLEPANHGLPEVEVVSLLYSGTTLLAASPSGLYRRADGDEPLWKASTQGLQQNDILCLAPDGEKAVLAGTTAGGVYRSTDAGRVWERLGGTATSAGLLSSLIGNFVELPTEGPLPAAAIRSLYSTKVDGSPLMLAGSDAGIHRSTNRGATWAAAGRGLPGFDSRAGTAAVQVYAFAANDDSSILAATSAGVYASTDKGRRWAPRNVGLPSTHPITEASRTAIRALAIVEDPRQGRRIVFAASDVGLWQSPLTTSGGEGSDPTWTLAPIEPPHEPAVLSLGQETDPASRARTIFAGTDRGLYVSADYGNTWSRGELGASTGAPIRAITFGKPGLAVASPFAGFALDQWPGFQLQQGEVDLESVISGLVPGTWVVLQPPFGKVEALEVQAVRNVSREDFTLSARISRLVVSRAADLSRFDLRSTTAWVRSEARTPVAEARFDLAGQTQKLIDRLQLLDPNHKVIVVAANLPWAQLLTLDFTSAGFGGGPVQEGGSEENGSDADLAGRVRDLADQRQHADGLESIQTAGQLISAIQALLTGLRRLREEIEAALADLEAGRISARDLASLPNSLERLGQPTRLRRLVPSSRPASSDEPDGPQAETAAANAGTAGDPASSDSAAGDSAAGDSAGSSASSPPANGETETTDAPDPDELAERIRQALDALSGLPGSSAGNGSSAASGEPKLAVYANVASTVEGATVTEVIGSGNPKIPNATFPLSRPLTFEMLDGLLQPSLSIRVSGQLWHRVTSLFGRRPDERIYMLDRTFGGQALVVFGDGTFGALPPEGSDNIIATYRTGASGAAVARDTLSLLQSRPLGLSRIWNPYAGTPGAAAEGGPSIRQRTPLWTRSLGRVVAFYDYQDFSAVFPGISKARVFSVVTRESTWIQVTVSLEGDPRPMDEKEIQAALSSLSTALDGARDSNAPFVVQRYEARPVSFDAVVELDPDPTSEEAWLVLEQELRQDLEARYGFENQSFGVSIAASEVVRRLQAHDKVRSVFLLDFGAYDEDRSDGVPALDRSVEGRLARSTDGSAGGIVAADLVWLLTDGKSRLRRASSVDPEELERSGITP